MAAGYYRTPKVHFDIASGRGMPFYYFAGGAAMVCCQLDTMSGEHRLLSVDILHDTGASINPAIDKGQIEGGFAQGWGWLSCEEVVWDERGILTTIGPATYKIPAAGDMPKHFRTTLWQKPNDAKTIMHSKATGEPPLMLALAGWCALADAIVAAGGDIKKKCKHQSGKGHLAFFSAHFAIVKNNLRGSTLPLSCRHLCQSPPQNKRGVLCRHRIQVAAAACRRCRSVWHNCRAGRLTSHFG